jgi:hypothetical protein
MKLVRALILALGFVGAASHAATPSTSYQFVKVPTGDYKSQWPLGDEPPEDVELSWDDTCLTGALTPILTQTVGDPQGSADVRVCLSGTESATASIVPVQQTGDSSTGVITAPTTGDSFLFDCDAPASGAFNVRAVYSLGGGVTSATQFSWTCNAAPAGGDLSDNANPGIYWQQSRSGQSLTQSYRCNTVYPAAFTKGNSTFKGMSTQYYWKDLEVGAGGWQTGVDLIKAELACLSVDPNNGQSYNPARRLIIGLREEKRNTDACSEIFPSYVCSATTSFEGSSQSWDYSGFGTSSWGIRWDIPAAKAAYFDMLTGIITALKADTAAWGRIEGFRLHQETGNDRYGLNVSTSEYTTFQVELATLIRELAPDKLILVNPTGGLSDKNAYLNTMKDLDVLVGHGDMLPCRANGDTDDCGPNDGPSFNPSGVDRDLTGDTGRTCSSCSEDRRSTSALWAAAEGSELGQCSFETYELQDIYDYINDYMQALYFLIDASDQSGTGGGCDASDATHATDISERKTFFHANPTLDNTTLPAHYP